MRVQKSKIRIMSKLDVYFSAFTSIWQVLESEITILKF